MHPQSSWLMRDQLHIEKALVYHQNTPFVKPAYLQWRGGSNGSWMLNALWSLLLNKYNRRALHHLPRIASANRPLKSGHLEQQMPCWSWGREVKQETDTKQNPFAFIRFFFLVEIWKRHGPGSLLVQRTSDMSRTWDPVSSTWVSVSRALPWHA